MTGLCLGIDHNKMPVAPLFVPVALPLHELTDSQLIEQWDCD